MICGKPVRYWQGEAFLFCQECLNQVHAGEPVLPCEPWSDEDPPSEERYEELFRVARVLFEAGITEEAEIIPTLVFAGRRWEMSYLERVRDRFVKAGGTRAGQCKNNSLLQDWYMTGQPAGRIRTAKLIISAILSPRNVCTQVEPLELIER